jgi:hypothetical protein
VRDLRAPRVKWRLCQFELPEDMRYIQPLGDAPFDEPESYEYRRINFTPEGMEHRKRSFGPFMDGIDARIERVRSAVRARIEQVRDKVRSWARCEPKRRS